VYVATDIGNSATTLVQPSNCLHRILSQRGSYATPRIFLEVREVSLVYGSFVAFLAGTIMLFIVAGWKWGLASLAIYWLLVVFVLIPLADRVRRGKSP
jgi:biotin transporter BioY